jgi:hypothetical protein
LKVAATVKQQHLPSRHQPVSRIHETLAFTFTGAQKTGDELNIEPTSCSNFKQGFTSGLTGTNSTFGYNRGPSPVINAGELNC